jgi:phosphatidylglycerol lysyltransferase
MAKPTPSIAHERDDSPDRARSAFRHAVDFIRRVDARVWFVLLAGFAIWFLIRERAEIQTINRVLRSANPWWVGGMVLVAVAAQVLFTAKDILIYRLMGKRVPVLPLVEVNFQRHILATIAPGGGPGSFLIAVRRFSEFGITADDVVLASVLYGLLGYSTFAIFLAPVIVWLMIHHAAPALLLAAAGILVALVVLMFLSVTWLLSGHAMPHPIARRLPRRVLDFVEQTRNHGIRTRQLIPTMILTLVIDASGVVMLWVCLRAVGVHASFWQSASGYSVGTLFLMLAPVFQGIGVVEVSMAVALERLGVGKAQALAATVIYRVGELWLPLIAAVASEARTRQGLKAAPQHLPAVLTGVTGFLSVFSVLAPELPRRVNRIENYSPFNPADFSRTFTLAAGFLLLFLSYSLWRRKRVAWLAASITMALVVISHLLKRHDELISLIALGNLAILLLYRKRFRVRSDVPTLARGVAQFAAALAFALLYGIAGFWLISRRDFATEFTLRESAENTIRLFFFLNTDYLHPRTRYADWFLDSFTVVGALSIAIAVFSLVRPVVWRRRTLPHERAEARALIETYGDSSLDFFKTWDDKFCFFSSTRAGVVGYGVAAHTAVSLGDPAAANEAEFRLVLEEFLDFCDANGWRAAFHQVPAKHLADYQEAGFSTVKIGEEAVLDLTAFSLTGNARKSLRAAVNKLEKSGFTASYVDAPQPLARMEQLREVSDAWLREGRRRERRFTLGQWDEKYVRSCDVISIEDPEGRIVAFANLVPDGAPGEATIDLMRHVHDGPNGLMDVLFVKLFDALKVRGYARFSLGMAPFAEVGSTPDSTTLERGIHLLGEHLNRFFSSKGLREYKNKFSPTWEPRYLVFPSEVALPAVTLALVRLTE